ncbi:hypothetical protein [Absidia glauca]|uniref:Barwin domain-containing protein n=1 Tax=Absidia glauca TaxID=4829 RepID=A0A168MQY9_ABSGL|nr:hypothetical protein [Absidia glauca]
MLNKGTATMMSFDDSSSKRGGQSDAMMAKRNRGTWYSGNDLKNAACYGRKGLPVFSARVSDMIGAMAMNDFEYCYKCMRITNTKNKHSVEVKIVDKCAACKVGTAIDLTPGAFEKLNPEGLADGVLDITWKVIPCHIHLHLVQ